MSTRASVERRQIPRVLTRRQAVALGVGSSSIDRRLASGNWRVLLPRTYLTVASATTSDRLAAALAYAGRDAALSGQAALWASDVRRIQEPAQVLVLVPTSNCSKSISWVHVRRTDRLFAVQPEYGPKRVRLARAAADHALTLRHLDDVRALVARVVQDGHCTIDELAVELRHGPRRHSAHLRTALEEVGLGAASAPEARAARVMRDAGIGGFIQNATVHLDDGTTYVLDFYWPGLRACLEIDSVEFHFRVDDWRRTQNRHLALTTAGYSVVHRPPSALADRGAFACEVGDWLTARATELGVPFPPPHDDLGRIPRYPGILPRSS